MRIMALLLLYFTIFSPAYAEAPHGVEEKDHALLFEIVEDQFVLNRNNIESAEIIEKNGIYSGLRIALKKNAAYVFEKIFKERVGQPINLVFNRQILSTAIIQAPLGNNFLITGISKENAQRFIKSLSPPTKKR